VDPLPDPLLLRGSGIAGNRVWTSGSVASNSGHKTTEAVNCTHEVEWTPFQTYYFSENLVEPEIEAGPPDL
jgi:hypothetical protein